VGQPVTNIAIIGGSGLSQLDFGADVAELQDHPYGEPSSPIITFERGNKKIVFLARHGVSHSIPPHRINYRANLWALKQLGVKAILAVNAVGAITGTFKEGALVVPDQIIDYSYGREHTFYDGLEYGSGADSTANHIDFTYPFSDSVRQSLFLAADKIDLKLHTQGVYGVTQGPRLETAAEIKRMKSDGCDVVGMTVMPEAALAKELGIAYASICVVVNPAAGIGGEEVALEKIHQVLALGMVNVKQLIEQWIKVL
jgi:5'-deoxy-5'-methylthioadenosine phosphorylase